MSTLYPDLSQTNFPNSIDTFISYLNITPTDGTLIKQYFSAIQAGNQALALQIFNQIPQGSQKILTANGLNKFSQCLTALERFYSDDIQTYITDKQTQWEEIIDNFQYIGVYSQTTQYVLNNYVTYTIAGATNLYIAYAQPPIGTPPSNTAYWRVLTIKGEQGASGVGMAFQGDWNAITPYSAMNCVTYDNTLWGCLIANTNQPPYEGSTYWQMLYTINVIIPTSATPPNVVDDGSLWFRVVTT